MEKIVFFNAGKTARMDGLPRECPENYEYPVVNRYQPLHTKNVRVEGVFRQAWFDGFDGKQAHLRS